MPLHSSIPNPNIFRYLLALLGASTPCIAGDITVQVNNIGYPKRDHDVTYVLVISVNVNSPDGSYEVHWDTGGTDSFTVTGNTVSGFYYDLSNRSYEYEVIRGYAGQTVQGPGKNGAIFYEDFSTDPRTLVPAGSWVGYHGDIEVIEFPASDPTGGTYESTETIFQSLTVSLGGLPPPPDDPPEGQEDYDGEWQENEAGDDWEWFEYITDQDNPPINPGGPGAGNWEWTEVLGEGYKWVWNGTQYSDNAAFVSGGGTVVPPTPYDPDPVGSGVTGTTFADLSGDDLQIATASESSTQLHAIRNDQGENSAEVVAAINQLRVSNENESQSLRDLLGEGATIQDLDLSEPTFEPWDIDDGTTAQTALDGEISARTNLANDFLTLPTIIAGFNSFFTLQSISLPQTSIISVQLPAFGEYYGGGQVDLDFADYSFISSIRALMAWIVYAMVVLASGKILMGMF